ncbi:nuclear transport factor 2 family protein [Micromonospora sp. RTGN7]|uniref:nuclear transport factor 2 family protein n=1 Tax=Micromonospora sp. RTGN7 TaxID=3016526 RepID=UPI0029FEFAE4|nr:nuclear transport factor 2 family protein [Micromonospora sp. RTGN7]
MTADDSARAIRVERVRRYYKLVDQGKTAELVALFSPDAVYHRPGYPTITGREELSCFYDGERMIREGRHTISTLISSSVEVAVHGQFHGVLRDGREVALRFADFFTFTEANTFSCRRTFFFTPLV